MKGGGGEERLEYSANEEVKSYLIPNSVADRDCEIAEAFPAPVLN
jgi:hypothetical protein